MKHGLTTVFFRRVTFACVAVFLHSITPLVNAAEIDVAGGGEAAKLYEGPKIKWARGQYLSVCDQFSQRCKSLKQPKALGNVEQMFPGPIIERAEASWIAISRFDTYVCALLQGTTKVVCAKLAAQAFPIDYAALRVQVNSKGSVRLAVKPNQASLNSKDLSDYAIDLNRAFKETVVLLQGEIDAAISPSYTFASTMSVCDKPPGPPPHPDCSWTGEMWSCPNVGEMPDPEIPPPPPLPDPEPVPGDDPEGTGSCG